MAVIIIGCEGYVFDVHTTVVVLIFRSESYAFDVHTTVISMMNDSYQLVPAEILSYNYNEAIEVKYFQVCRS